MEPWKDRYKLNLALPGDLAQKLRDRAAKEHRTLTGQIIHLLYAALEETDEPTAATQRSLQ